MHLEWMQLWRQFAHGLRFWQQEVTSSHEGLCSVYELVEQKRRAIASFSTYMETFSPAAFFSLLLYTAYPWCPLQFRKCRTIWTSTLPLFKDLTALDRTIWARLHDLLEGWNFDKVLCALE